MAVTKGKGQNSFTKRKAGECFQWKANGSCSKVDSCSFLHSHGLGNRKSIQPDRRRKGREQASSSVPTGKGQTDDKRSKSLEARPATTAEFPCLWGPDVEKRHVIIGILPCVVITSLETGAFVAIIACIDMLMVKRNPARGRKVRVLKEQLRF